MVYTELFQRCKGYSAVEYVFMFAHYVTKKVYSIN